MVCITRRAEGSEDSGYGSQSATNGFTTIEHWVASKDKFRVASSGLPIPKKSRVGQVNDELREVYETSIAHEIPNILATHGITFRTYGLYRLEPLDETYEARDVLRILTSNTNPAAWRTAANYVHNYVKQRALSHTLASLQVEISNAHMMYDDVSYAIPDDPTLIESLTQVKGRIVNEVSASMQNVWTSIAFHMRSCRHTNERQKPTVIVFCRPKSTYDFASAEARLSQILIELEMQVHLEFLPGRVVLAPSELPMTLPMATAAESLPQNPVNGSSIGIRGRDAEAGTLGGWLILSLPRENRKVKCALTCYHAIRSGDASVSAHTDKHGVHWNDQRGHLDIEYPAALDSKEAMAHLEELCKNEPHDQELKQQHCMLPRLISGPGIGKVLLASGYHRKDNQCLDWALIESPSTFSLNKPPRSPLRNSPGFMLPGNGLRYNPHPDANIRSFGYPVPNNWVAKEGRTTTTSGIINRMSAIVHWDNSGNPSEETEVISSTADFAADGDSGAFVVNVDGELVGLLFAVEKNVAGFDSGFMTPFSLIQDHVKEMTNGGYLSFD
ncbi:uncharacterized protein GIQ15_06101 [Arthroderma uncinatum]|uniref:uncharacterized protein n=1 Tax=Arthroderma uncinatum TaxID=74035 RepID=UPI00144AD68E|nr:uncharacterized protein GIQ15_06101 [Arthroderma uncinatum]KAF3480754.1 hypothetical protein GIQ15_06101 [Arthroderma uncinatum]